MEILIKAQQFSFEKMNLKMLPAKCPQFYPHLNVLTHWGGVTHICVIKLTIIDSDNGLVPGLPQAIIWTSAGILLIGLLVTNFSEMLIKMIIFSFKKNYLNFSSGNWQPFCLSFDVFMGQYVPEDYLVMLGARPSAVMLAEIDWVDAVTTQSG